MDYLSERLDFVSSRVSDIPEEERTTVAHGSSIYELDFDGANTIIDQWITYAGGINAAAEGLEGNLQTISIEQVMEWDPDVLITGRPQSQVDEIMADEVWANLEAVKNHRVYSNPRGVFASAGAKNTGRLRFVCGATAEELEAKNAAGNRMPSGVIEITVVTAPKVRVTNQGLKVNGEDKSGDIYNISGKNYFKLRDLAMLLNGTPAQFSVDFDTENSIVYVTPGEAYTPVGGELAAGEDRSASCVESRWTLRIAGGNVDIAAYNMGGNNYFQLRQLGEILGFEVDYDEASRTMLVTSK